MELLKLRRFYCGSVHNVIQRYQDCFLQFYTALSGLFSTLLYSVIRIVFYIVIQRYQDCFLQCYTALSGLYFTMLYSVIMVIFYNVTQHYHDIFL